MARFESTACRLELGAATNATRVGNNGVFSNLIAGRIRSTEMTKIARVLRKQTGTAIHFDSPLAKGGLGNHFNPLTNEIHLFGGASMQRRGLFYEEVQRALDHHAGAYGILSEQGGYVLNKEFLSDQGLHRQMILGCLGFQLIGLNGDLRTSD